MVGRRCGACGALSASSGGKASPGSVNSLTTTETNSSRPRWPLAFELASRCGQHLQRSRTRVLQAFTVLRTQYNSGVPLPYRLGCSDSCVVPTLQPSIQSSKSSPPLGRCIFIFRVSCTMGSPPPITSVGCHYAVDSTRPGEQYRWGPGHENELPARFVQEHFGVCLFEQLQAALSQGSIDRDWQAVLQTTEARGCDIPPDCRSNCRSLTTSRVKPRTVGPNLTEVAFSPRAQPRSAAELLACTPQISTLPSRARERPALFPAVRSPHSETDWRSLATSTGLRLASWRLGLPRISVHSKPPPPRDLDSSACARQLPGIWTRVLLIENLIQGAGQSNRRWMCKLHQVTVS